MKYLLSIFFLALATLAVGALTGCVDYNDATTGISAAVRVARPEGFADTVPLEGRQVTLSQGARTYTATTDADGVARFEGIVPDIYTVTTSWRITGAQYGEYTGRLVQNEDYIVSGNLLNRLFNGSEGTVALSTTATVTQSIVISKIYASGSKDGNNRNYDSGKYIEFYNNSDTPIDIAGMYFGLIESDGTPAYLLANADNSVYLKQLYRFPAGAPKVLEPGASVVVANSAIDHTQNNAPAEHDLSNADYEAKDQTGRTVNNPATAAVELVYTAYDRISMMNLVQGGPSGVVLFAADEADVATWEKVYAYGKTRGTRYLKVPATVVKDAVDVLKYAANGVDVANKRLFDFIDGGFTVISSASGRNGEVLYRKVGSTAADGRRMLQDTNNSTNDFAVSASIAPRAFQ